jgi:hypothetical protein
MHSGNRFDEDIFETGMVLEQNANTWELTKLQENFLVKIKPHDRNPLTRFALVN